MKIIALGFSLVCLPSTGWAQAASNHSDGIVIPAGETSVTSTMVRTSHLSPDDKLAYATAVNLEMVDAYMLVSDRTAAARREGGLERLTCLHRALNALDELMDVGTSAETRMKRAMSTGRLVAADHQFRVMGTALNQVRTRVNEAKRCVGDHEMAPVALTVAD